MKSDDKHKLTVNVLVSLIHAISQAVEGQRVFAHPSQMQGGAQNSPTHDMDYKRAAQSTLYQFLRSDSRYATKASPTLSLGGGVSLHIFKNCLRMRRSLAIVTG